MPSRLGVTDARAEKTSFSDIKIPGKGSGGGTDPGSGSVRYADDPGFHSETSSAQEMPFLSNRTKEGIAKSSG